MTTMKTTSKVVVDERDEQSESPIDNFDRIVSISKSLDLIYFSKSHTRFGFLFVDSSSSFSAKNLASSKCAAAATFLICNCIFHRHRGSEV